MVTEKEIRIKDESELAGVARELLQHHSGERIFAFFGKMGVGKTTFIKAICQEMEVQDVVGSPTFSLINQYLTRKGDTIYHFDFYRVKKLEEVFDLGYEDYFFSGSYCLIEWPEKTESLLPENAVKVYMEEDAGERIIKY